MEGAFFDNRERKLWRIDTLMNKSYLLILSVSKPNLTELLKQFGYEDAIGQTKEYNRLLNQIEEKSVWHFRLVANPVHSIKTGNGRGKVVAHVSEHYQLEWLNNQAIKKGFCIVSDTACVKESNWKIFNKRNSNKRVRILAVTFEGILRVEDVEVFKNTLLNGIGRGKAYGMGLLTIVRTEV